MKILNKKIARKSSSADWMRRQLDDPYVKQARKDGYRARAAYKLSEINEKFRFLKNGQVVVDLGAAPGSWSQYVLRNFPKSRVIAMDLLPIEPFGSRDLVAGDQASASSGRGWAPGLPVLGEHRLPFISYQGDFTSDEAVDWLNEQVGYSPGGATFSEGRLSSHPGESRGEDETQDLTIASQSSKACFGETRPTLALQQCKVDVVLSDMAPNTTGHQKTDHLRQMVLLEYAWDFAKGNLRPGGTFVAKSFTGGTTADLLKEMRRHFDKVHHIKPPASRKDSVEMFVVGIGFKPAAA